MKKVPDLFYKFFPELHVPGSFWSTTREKQDDNEKCKDQCVYFAVCTEEEFLYATDEFERILGYPANLLSNQGLKWWFTIIHPEDIGHMLNVIFQHCFLLPVNKRLNKPFKLAFRVKHADGRWIWIEETKCIVGVTDEGKNHFILGRFEEVSRDKELEECFLSKIIEQDGKTNSMLKAAMPILNIDHHSQINVLGFHKQYIPPPGVSMPTKREKEILHLIGEGYSTKQIANKLDISINTVETHRRHLLEKIQVKNSMELIKQTANAVWIKAI